MVKPADRKRLLNSIFIVINKAHGSSDTGTSSRNTTCLLSITATINGSMTIKGLSMVPRGHGKSFWYKDNPTA